MFLQGCHMLLRAVPLIALPTILGMRFGRLQHDPIAPFLRDDGSSADRRFDPVAAHNSARGPDPFCTAALRRLVAVDQDDLRFVLQLSHQIAHAARHCEHGGLEDVDLVNLARIHHGNRPLACPAKLLIEHSAAFGR